ncbi:MAG: metallopeptidase TldD-related protein [Candidatus Binataceae bacterium]
MLTSRELVSFAKEAMGVVAREADCAAFEIYCSSSEQIVARLNYTCDIPCRGVEEIKSLAADGFALRIVSRRNPCESGVAFEAGDLSIESVRAALSGARRAVVVDPHFPGLPARPKRLQLKPAGAASDLMRAGSGAVIPAAWAIVRGGAAAFAALAPRSLRQPGLIIGGDISIIRDRIAIANSNFQDLRTDQSAYFSSSVTALVEALDAKGTASAIGASLAAMNRMAPQLGSGAVSRALKLLRGERPPGGAYRVLLGPQPVAEILNYVVMGSLTTGAFYAANSAYQSRLGEQVMDARISLFDDPAFEPGALGRRITCEGLPARRTEMVRAGRLVGLLSNFYDANRLAADPERAAKLGPAAGDAIRFPVRSGYRLGEGGGRRFDANPAAVGTNVVMRARDGVNERALLKALGDGIYVGRVWYTYPINGQRAGDFSCTISGDSYLVKNGKVAAPLAPNSLRINAHIDQVFRDVVAIAKRAHPALIWGAPEAYYVPAIVVDGLALAAVGD